MAGKTVAIPAPSTVEVAGDLTTLKVADIIRQGGKIRLPEVDGEQQAFDMLTHRLEADTAEALFSDDAGNVLKANEIIGQPFRLNSVEFRNSDLDAYPEGIGIFGVLHIDLDGKAETLIVGANDVILKAMRAVELGVLPRWLAITESTTKAGRTVMNLVDASNQSGEAF